jgi:hypothetical protein
MKAKKHINDVINLKIGRKSGHTTGSENMTN